jgi:hypothetical protein
MLLLMLECGKLAQAVDSNLRAKGNSCKTNFMDSGIDQVGRNGIAHILHAKQFDKPIGSQTN